MAIRVAVAGVLGRMGRTACVAVDAADDLIVVGGFDRAHAGEALGPHLGLPGDFGKIFDSLEDLFRIARPEVLVDFTLHEISPRVAAAAVESGVSPVVGVSGWTDSEVQAFRELCAHRRVGAALIPNFALGAVLMMRFAEAAARYFPTAEIVELHHDRKLDKPSGTARATAARLAAASGRAEVPIHSVRLRGLVARQEVLFGGEGETLSIRHDSLSRESFAAGIVLAVRHVREHDDLVVGLDRFLEE
ncbi:MAG TPA: 4-hydroxy-tetrahydrodipicolinate reductase [Candidatus Baltobacteraceae bacterium]|jgi:4-hydroxy-tetrahydrodipicolinate reductase|nr:4-hydroxy-tetrahydrodipicolinate reductase [Candidatus Baltobacteraceae bacterium]